jgi:hypothetical protein
MVMNELEGGLSHHSLITDEELKKEYKELLAVVREEYEDILKGEVPAGDQLGRGRGQAAGGQLHRERPGVHPARAGAEQVHRPRGGAGRPADAEHRGEDRHPREPQGRLPPGDHELHRGASALDGKRFEYNTNARLLKALELKLFEDQRDTIKLKNLGQHGRRRRDPAEDRRRQAAADQVLRVQRDERDRRAELRREHLRPRRQQAGRLRRRLRIADLGLRIEAGASVALVTSELDPKSDPKSAIRNPQLL